jgi:hypothetical protein
MDLLPEEIEGIPLYYWAATVVLIYICYSHDLQAALLRWLQVNRCWHAGSRSQNRGVSAVSTQANLQLLVTPICEELLINPSVACNS